MEFPLKHTNKIRLAGLTKVKRGQEEYEAVLIL